MKQTTPTIFSSTTQPKNHRQLKMNIKQEKQARIFFDLGKALAKKGEWEEAIAAYQKAIKLDPDLEEVKQYLVDAENHLQQHQEANEKLKKASQFGKILTIQGKSDVEKIAANKTIKEDSNSANNYHLQGDALVEKGEKEEAIKVYTKAVEIQPELWEVHHKLGDLLQDKEELEAAVYAYNKSIELKSDFCWSYNNLGDVLVKLEKWQEALSAYRRTVELNPDFTWGYYKLGNVLFELEDKDETIEVYKKVLELKSGWVEIEEKLAGLLQEKLKQKGNENNGLVEQKNIDNEPWLTPHKQGDELRKQGKLDEAIAAYRQAIEVNPGYTNSYYELGKLLQEKGKLEEAIATYTEATELAPQESLFHHALANSLLANHQFDEAVTFYKNALKLQPNSPDTYKELATTLVTRIEFDSDRAIDFYRQAIFLNPEDIESLNCLKKIEPNNSDIYLELAQFLVEENHIKSGIHACEIAIDLQIEHPHLSKLYNFALSRKEKADNDLALQDHYKKLQDFPENPAVYLELGKALVEQNRIDNAIVFYQMALQIQPDYAEIYFEMGNALKAQENFFQAIECYRKAIEIRPDYCWYYNGLGDILKSTLDFDEAINAYRKAIELESNFAGFNHNLEAALKEKERIDSIKDFCQDFSHPRKSKIEDGQSLKILMVTSYPPYPPNSGAPMRMFEEIKYLGSRHHLVVVSFIFSEEDYAIETELANYCDRAIMTMLGAPYSARNPNDPKQIYRWHTWNMRKILEELRIIDFDVVLFDFIYLASYVDLFADTYTVLQEHNIESNLLQQCALASKETSNLEEIAADVDAVKAFLDADKEAKLLQDYEKRNWPKFDLVTLVSESDRKQLEERCPTAKTLVVENGTDTIGITPVNNTQARKMLFMGNLAYYPNIDGVMFFVEEILPKIWEQDPELVFCVAGRDPGKQIQELAKDPRIEVVASPKDMSEVAKDCMMSVVPLRLGSGTRLKVLHSMAMGLPVISTSLGCEGLLVTEEVDIAIGDDPQKFADGVVKMSRDGDFRDQLRLNGLELVKNKYDWKSIFSNFEKKLLSM
ncbi:tetratricopeptide repeat protein [Dapis sp. BLCC M172]|uniref:tetratricopeptide repeat protein n=1 Tax=Dapis sp. BLCC M172 TaxID=2975281 RepID=UPI003CEC8E16